MRGPAGRATKTSKFRQAPLSYKTGETMGGISCSVRVLLIAWFSLHGAPVPAKHTVSLAEEQRHRLDRLTRTGHAHARAIRHAHILLLADASESGPAWTDEEIADALGCGTATVARVRRRFVTEGLGEAIRVRKAAPGRPPKLDGTAEAHLIALARSGPPEGRARWSLRLLVDRFVEVALEEALIEAPVSYETVRQVLKKRHVDLTRAG